MVTSRDELLEDNNFHGAFHAIGNCGNYEMKECINEREKN